MNALRPASMSRFVLTSGPVLGLVLAAAGACVPPGNSTPSDSGAPSATATTAPLAKPSAPPMTAVFTDNFDRPNSAIGAPLSADAAVAFPFTLPSAAPSAPSSRLVTVLGAGDAASDHRAPEASAGDAMLAAANAELEPIGPDWLVTQPERRAWRIENGRLCGEHARNHGVWLKRVLPVNARIEYDAIALSDEGDIKSEVWGDGQSAATSTSYVDATSYLAIFGGWHNRYHVLARINEHGNDRKEIKIDPTSDDPREKPVNKGQQYHIKVERTDGHTVKYYVDDVLYLEYNDAAPLVGAGHDHFGFNEWMVKVCFDNVRVTPL